MAGFQAQGVVEALDYDLRPYVNAHGTIPEPTDRQIADFISGLKGIAEKAKKDIPAGVDMNDAAAVLAAIDDLDPDQLVTHMAEMCEIYAKLCAGTPSKEQISELPMRVRQVFFNWVQGEVLAPEAVTGGGNVREISPRGARAG